LQVLVSSCSASQPESESHASSVQGLPSSQTTGSCWQAWSMQASSVHGPASQSSSVLQHSGSTVSTQKPMGHRFSVQTSPSAQSAAPPQVPLLVKLQTGPKVDVVPSSTRARHS